MYFNLLVCFSLNDSTLVDYRDINVPGTLMLYVYPVICATLHVALQCLTLTSAANVISLMDLLMHASARLILKSIYNITVCVNVYMYMYLKTPALLKTLTISIFSNLLN